MAYISKYSGEELDASVSINETQNTQLTELQQQLNEIKLLITTIETSINNLKANHNSDISNLQNNITNIQNNITNIQEPWTGTQIIKSGTFSGTASLTYTATENCIIYISFYIQANSSGGAIVKLNNQTIMDMDELKVAMGYQVNTIPIFLKTNDIIYAKQTSNVNGKYVIMSLQ